MRAFDHSLSIAAPAARILDAFFDADDLAAWWHVTRSLCTPRDLGSYAVEWPATEARDEVLGRWGGVFRGTVMEFTAARRFFVADSYWLPPDGEPVGPMAFEAACAPLGDRVMLHVRQSGGDRSERWTRYYELLEKDLTQSLGKLKAHVEKRT